MKTTILLTLTTALVFGLNGCTDAEMAEVEQGIEQGIDESANMTQMERDCKNYMAQKISELPMAAFSISAGYGNNGRYTIPVRINWDEPRVEETGYCRVVNGIVRNYVRTSE